MAIRKVLIVDDSPTDLTNLEKIISDTDRKVITASNGSDAIEKAIHGFEGTLESEEQNEPCLATFKQLSQPLAQAGMQAGHLLRPVQDRPGPRIGLQAPIKRIGNVRDDRSNPRPSALEAGSIGFCQSDPAFDGFVLCAGHGLVS